jgi:molecular chaperone Hsp33
MDRLIHATAAGGTVRVIAGVTTGIVAEAVRRHGTSPTVSAAFGRMLTGALLLAATLKEFDRLTLKIESDGPVKGITAEASSEGTVRGFVKNSIAEPPAKSNGKFDVSRIVGEGTFYVIREAGFELGFRPEPYVGSVPIVSGEIAEDLAYYLAKSEQIPSGVSLGVLLSNTEPYVTASGGLLVQMMPGAEESVIGDIENVLSGAPHVTEKIVAGAMPEDIARMALGGRDLDVLEEREIAFRCNCSREKAYSMIAALGEDEIRSMIREDRGAVMACGFCNESYSLSEPELEGMLTSVDGG